MAHLTGQELHERQFDILWDLLSDNPLLPASSVPALNKALQTKNKNVIKAINEILAGLKANDATVDNFTQTYNEILGNALLEPELLENLRKIDTNVLKAIYKIYLEISGDPDNPINISHISDSLKGAILELDEALRSLGLRVDTIEEIVDDVEYKDELTVNESNPNEFTLKFTPSSKLVKLFINGISYEENDDFIVDRENKKLIWTFDSANGGFDLLSEFEIYAEYEYDPD